MKNNSQGTRNGWLTRNARFLLLFYFTVVGFQQDIHYCKIAMREPSLENAIALESQRFASSYDWNDDEIHIVPPQARWVEPARFSESSIAVRATKGNPSNQWLRSGQIRCRSPPQKCMGINWNYSIAYN